MVYVKGETVINFYEENIKEQSEKEFVEANKHHGLNNEELKQIHSLIQKKKRKAVKAEPPSLN